MEINTAGHRLWSRPVKRLLLVVVGMLALASVLQGSHAALNPIRSQDLQWSGERMLLQHIDPWAEYLRGDPEHRILLTQIPNYLPVLYLLILPIGFLTALQSKMAWALCNVGFAIASGILAGRFYGLRSKTLFLTICLFLMSTPVRNTIGNGQQCLLVLILWCLSLLSFRLDDADSGVAGISCFKFNFAPPVVFYLFLRRGVRAVFWSAVPSAVATTIIWLWLSGGHDPRLIGRLIVEPLAVSQRGYFPSGSNPNLMDVLETVLVLFRLPERIVNPLILAVACILCFAMLYLAMRRYARWVEWHLALLAIMSFGFFRHHDYDSVVLLLPLAYAMQRRSERAAQAILGLGAFLWYGQRLIDALPYKPSYEFVVQWGALMAMLVLTYRMQPTEFAAERDGEMLLAA